MALAVKISPASAGDIRDKGSIPGSESSHGGRHGNPLQHSCLENPMDRGAARQTTVRRVAKSLTRLKRFSKQGLDIKTASKFMHETLSGTRDSLISQSSWKPHTESKDTKYVEI